MIAPHIIKKLNEQVFLLHKLKHCLEKIESHQDEFLNTLNQLHLEAAIAKFREHVKGKPDTSVSASFSIDANVLLINTPFVYYLDSFVIDVKRVLLFCLLGVYVAWRGHDNDTADIKFHATFLNQIHPNHNQQKKEFIKFLLQQEEASGFVAFARDNHEWLGKLNGRRTLIEHASLSYGIDRLTLELSWGKDQKPTEHPEIVDFGKLMMRGKPLLVSLQEEIQFLRQFRSTSLDVLKDLGHVQR